MYALMEECYEGVTRRDFDDDLREKQQVILVEAPDSGELLGFSTLKLLHARDGERTIHALFSGDTVVTPSAWGDVALPRVWGRYALSLMERFAGQPLYWFLISKGYKTYRFLPLFFHEYYPRCDRPTPLGTRRILDALASSKFPGRYDAEAGIVRADPVSARLRRGIADITDQRQKDPHVRFFARCNPGHARGDELCCLAPLTPRNFTRAAYRVIGRSPATRLAT
jgi:hypothetical protein